MKLVVNLKLKPDAMQQRALQETLERCNAACNRISEIAFENKTFKQFALQKISYRETRERFGLTAQAAIRCIAKVADAYKLKNADQTLRHFRKWAAQPYDDRIFRFAKNDAVNLWTVNGRMTIPFVCGEHQRKLLPFRKGEVDLMFVRGKWYVACVGDIDEPELMLPDGVLGVDLGIVQIATDSEGKAFSGAQVEAKRQWYAKRRRALQKVGTKAAKRRLRKIRGKQRRFQTITNHSISKAIVEKAKRYGAIGLEDLKHIRSRVKANKQQRQRLNNWGFAQLRAFIEYKAKRKGVHVHIVDPRYTSRTCPVCGLIDKANRPEQSVFRCVGCGHRGNADHIAAGNIAGRVAVNLPMFAHRHALGAVESLRL